MDLKKLYISKTERRLGGVCGVIAVYLNIDPTIVRLIWAFVSLMPASVPGILIYVICALVVPDEPDAYETTAQYYDEK